MRVHRFHPLGLGGMGDSKGSIPATLRSDYQGSYITPGTVHVSPLSTLVMSGFTHTLCFDHRCDYDTGFYDIQPTGDGGLTFR